MKDIKISLKLLLIMTLLTGVLYTGAVTVVSQLLFPKMANGSLIFANGKAIGSSLLSQKFISAKYFWPRPSASDYKAVPSGASNLGPTSADLKKQVDERSAVLQKSHGSGIIPLDLLFASGSGLDPHISLAAAEYQIQRVASVRGVSSEIVKNLVHQNLEKRQLGFLGEDRVNVLKLNLDLDKVKK